VAVSRAGRHPRTPAGRAPGSPHPDTGDVPWL